MRRIMNRPKLIIIHGLNNTPEAFYSLGRSFEDHFQVIYFKLPQHGQLHRSFHFQHAIDQFVQELTTQFDQETSIISYSLGCAYLQYALEQHLITCPLKRIIYLSPAVKTKLNLALLASLPALLPVPSFAPKDLRFRSFCYLGQYQTLFKLTQNLVLDNYPLIYADPKDELIDLKGLSFQSINREYLKTGEHHLTFHPRYYREDEWIKLINDLKTRLLTI